MLKAFAVQEEDEGTGGIFYAKHDISARKAGANEFGDGDLHGITCRRVPWADEYAPGPCPLLVMVDHGWHMECSGCAINIDSDLEFIPDDPAEPVLTLVPVEDGHGLFCTEECRQRYLTDRAERKIYTQWMCDMIRTALAKTFPGVTEVSGEGRWAGPYTYVDKQDGFWTLREGSVAFTFPGSTIGPAQLRFGKEGWHAHICQGDMPAWEAWRSTNSTTPN